MVIYAVVAMTWMEFETGELTAGTLNGVRTLVAVVLSLSLMGNIIVGKMVWGKYRR